MATLVSPGVDITVSDESFYSPGGPGTVPLIILATHQLQNTKNSLHLTFSQKTMYQVVGHLRTQ